MSQLHDTSTAGKIVPTTGAGASLTIFVAGAMAFLSVFALALLLANGRAAERWSAELDGTATIRIPGGNVDQAEAVLQILGQTPGVTASRLLDDDDQRALLEPWFGPDLPVDLLDLPRLVEMEVTPDLDTAGLNLRLEAEAPGAIFDDHGRWREPMLRAAGRLRLVGVAAMALLLGSLIAMIAVATRAALAGSAQVIDVLRLIGAEDRFVVRAFTRRFAIRSALGALIGAGAGLLAVLSIPRTDTLAMDVGFRGLEWIWAFAIPLLASLIAYATTRIVTQRRLKETL